MKMLIANAVLFISLLALATFSFAAGHFVAVGNFSNSTAVPHTIQLTGNETRTVPIAAIDNFGRGSISQVSVEIGDGNGRIMALINNVLADTDTQQSERAAVSAASSYLNADFSDKDIIFSINSDAAIVSGPSAGSAMAIALVFAASDKDLDSRVAMTGALTSDGRIRPVDGLLSKAIAARESGYTLFLIPEEEIGYTYFINGQNDLTLEEAAGIQVIGVSTLSEAVLYFKL